MPLPNLHLAFFPLTRARVNSPVAKLTHLLLLHSFFGMLHCIFRTTSATKLHMIEQYTNKNFLFTKYISKLSF